MRIGYFVTEFPYLDGSNPDYWTGGVGEVAYNLAVEMAKLGHEIFIFTTSLTYKDYKEELGNIKVYRYAKSFKIGQATLSHRLLYKPFKQELDIVHAHMGNPPAPIGALRYAQKKKKPFVITYHGDPQEKYGNLIRRATLLFYIKFYLHKILLSANKIICPSQPFVDSSRFLKNYRSKIQIIPNGININKSTPPSKEKCRARLGLPLEVPLILFVGALEPYKGPDVLVKSMSYVVKRFSSSRLVFIGKGGMRKKLEQLVRELNLSSNVFFTGYLPDEKKLLYFGASDVFVLPSILKTELFPIALLEAAVAALPLVTSDLPTFKCFIENGKNGILTERGNEKVLADAIISLLENEEKRKKMGLNARKKAEKYSWKNIAKETEKLYEEVLS